MTALTNTCSISLHYAERINSCL